MEKNSLLVKAMRFAVYKHRLQRRKNEEGEAYITHPFRVEELLEQAGVEQIDTLCAAILHDTVEDTDTTIDEIKREFGEKISLTVSEVTDDKKLPKGKRKLAQIEKAKNISFSGMLIKLADKMDNLRDLFNNPPKDWTKERIEGYAVWCRAVTEEIKKRYNIYKYNEEHVSFYRSIIKCSCMKKLLDQLDLFYDTYKILQSKVKLEDYIESMGLE